MDHGPPPGDTPFFLWLENHQVCLEDDKGKVETHGVAYVRAERRETADSRSRLKLLIVGSPIQSVDLTKMGGAVEIASTVGYQAERRKDPRGEASFGADVAAFVWTEATEPFIANHSAQEFHHSSFISQQLRDDVTVPGRRPTPAARGRAAARARPVAPVWPARRHSRAASE